MARTKGVGHGRVLGSFAFALLVGCGRSHGPSITGESAEVDPHSATPSQVVAPVPPPPPPPPPKTTRPCQPGPILIPPASDADKQRLVESFSAKNGTAPSNILLDRSGRQVWLGQGFGSASGMPGSSSGSEREAAGRAFLKANAEHLGITPDDVDALEALVDGESIIFTFKGPYPGYEALRLERKLRVEVAVDGSGVVRSVANSNNTLPHFFLCTTPVVAISDPRLRAELVGWSTEAHGMSGKLPTRTAEDKDIGEPYLEVDVEQVDSNVSGQVVISLAYAIDIFGHDYTAVIDANTATRIRVRPNIVY